MTRDEKGRFIKGSSGNPTGRAPKDREERYYAITMTACTFDDWKAIVDKAVEQAKRGDAVARKWLADYLVGVPEQSTNNELIVRYVNDWRDPTAEAPSGANED